MLVVLSGWVFFRAPSLSEAIVYFKALFGQMVFRQEFGVSYYVQSGTWFVAGIATIMAFGGGRFIFNPKNKGIRFFSDIFLWFVLGACIVLLTANSYSPFIYFNF